MLFNQPFTKLKSNPVLLKGKLIKSYECDFGILFLLNCKYHINERRFAKQDISLTHLGKRKEKTRWINNIQTMDSLNTYRIQRTISELKSFFDLLDEMMFFISLSISLKTFAAGSWILL